MKLDIIGWYNEKNCGDEAFRLVFEQYLGHHSLNFGNRYRSGDRVIFGGGGVLQGSYLEGLPIEMRLLALGVDISLSGTWWDKIIRMPFERVYLRSQEYAQIADSQGLSAGYCPDIVFGLSPKVYTKRQRVGVVLSSDLLQYEWYKEWFPKVLEVFCPSEELVFLSFYNGNSIPDQSVNETIGRTLSRRVEYLSTQDPLVMFDWVSSLRQLITMRFHGSIFATITGTPFLSLARPGKNSLFLEQEFLSDQYLDITRINQYKMERAFSYLNRYEDSIRNKLLGISAQNRSLVREAFLKFEDLL